MYCWCAGIPTLAKGRMIKNRVVYSCFVTAVFIISLYNFLALTLSGLNDHMKSNAIINSEWNVVSENAMTEEELIFDILEADYYEKLPEPKIFFPQELDQRFLEIESLEVRCPKFQEQISRGIIKTKPAEWNKCGRANNAYGQLNDYSSICIRHRNPHLFLVAGEILSFTLARILGLSTVPCVTLNMVDPSTKWKTNVTKLGWSRNDTVAIIEWIETLQKLKMPENLIQSLMKGKPLHWTDIEQNSQESLFVLSQWSDMIVFDFLTGHFDRFASLQDEADKQKDEKLLSDKVRNVGMDSNGFLWFFDNEAGMLDAYMLMYKTTSNLDHIRFPKFHLNMLNSLCVFRKQTIQRVTKLYHIANPATYILQNGYQNEPFLERILVTNDERLDLFLKHFNSRLTQLIAHWKKCADYSLNQT